MLEGNGRRQFTADEKVAIVLEGVRGDPGVSEVCRRHGITTNQFYQWRETLVGAAKEAFARPRGRKGRSPDVELLRAEVARKDAVIAEITGEILKVKKGLWP
jgi:transposase